MYDIYTPSIEKISDTINKMQAVLEMNVTLVNPGCCLKTRKYAQVQPALMNMVSAAKLS